MSFKNKVKKFVVSVKPGLNSNEFKTELLKKHPELKSLNTFDYYSTKYAQENGYVITDLVSMKDAVNEIVTTIKPNLSIEDLKTEILSKYPHLEELSSFDFSLNRYAKEQGYQFKETRTTSIRNKNRNEIVIDETKRTDLVIETVTEDNIDKEKLKTVKTETPFDILASDFGGFMRGTQYEVSAPAGTGKTTLLNQIASDLEANNKGFKALFISAEMSRDDWEVEVYKNPTLGGIDTVFLLDLDEDEFDIKGVLLNALKAGDFIILDSSSSVIDLLMEQGESRGVIERWLRKNIISISREQRSIIMTIKHVNKDGKTAGSTKDKHYFTGKMKLEIDKNGERCVFFSKNRRGGENQNRKMFFNRNDEGKLVFNQTKFDNDTLVNEIVETTRETDDNHDEDFAQLFKSKLEILDEVESELN